MGISMRAYAQQRGVSHEAVRKAIATGRIHPEPDGSIDPIKADAQWDRHTRTAQPTTPKASASRASAPPPQAPQSSDDTRGVDYHKARAVRETYAARLAKLDFEERLGEADQQGRGRHRVFTLARQLRDRLQQIPRKVAPEIVALVVASPDVRGVTDLLDAAIREALEELSR